VDGEREHGTDGDEDDADSKTHEPSLSAVTVAGASTGEHVGEVRVTEG
jgi:hypothetical protein